MEAPDLEAHLLAQVRIEIGERLVEEKHLGLDHHRAREGHALLLAAGELGGIALLELVEMNDRKHAPDPLGDLGPRQLAHAQPEGDVLGDRHVRPDRVALEYHRHAPALRGENRTRRGERHPVHLDRPLARRHEAGDHAQGRRLAATRRAEERDELARLQRQIEVGHGGHLAEALAETLERELGHPAPPAPPVSPGAA